MPEGELIPIHFIELYFISSSSAISCICSGIKFLFKVFMKKWMQSSHGNNKLNDQAKSNSPTMFILYEFIMIEIIQ
jgi:hypothetical protein